MKPRCISVVLLILVLGTLASHAQLADTIWEGKASVSGFSLQPCIGGLPKPDMILGGLKLQIPFEVWFLDSANLLVVGRRDKMGGDPANQKYLLFWGLFPGEENGRSHLEQATYRAERRSGTYSFACSRTRLAPDSVDSYQGQKTAMNGFFSVKGDRLVLSRPVFSFTPNPLGPRGPKVLGVPKFAFTQLSKTSRKPSQELVGWEE